MVLDSYGHETLGWSQLYATNPNFATTYQLLGASILVFDFHLHDGFLCHFGHLYVPSSECMKIIQESNYSLVAGHLSVEKTVLVLKKYFYWPKLWHDFNRYNRSYTIYDIAKLLIKKQGMYTPFPTFGKPWESISMDFISGLPSTKHGNDHIFVFVDQFSKMAILTACKKTIIAKAMTKLFLENFLVHFGNPQTIISY